MSKGILNTRFAMVWSFLIVLALCMSSTVGPAHAQDPNSGLGGFGALPGLDNFAGVPVTFSSQFEAVQGSDRGRLSITAELENEYHIYSVTQPKGGPLKTTFKVVGKDVEVTGAFVPDQPPEKGTEDFGNVQVPAEKHYGKVTWTAPIKFAAGTTPEKLKFKVEASGQVCSKNCVPVDETVESTFAGFYTEEAAPPTVPTAEPTAVGTDQGFRDPDSHVTWTAFVSPGAINAGSSAELKITAQPDEGYHVYPVKIADKETNFRTQIVVTEKAGLRFGMPVPSSPAKPHEYLPGEPPMEYHDATVTWTVPIFVPEQVGNGKVTIQGLIGYQACNDESCDSPMGIEFKAQVEITDSPASGIQVVTLKETPFKTVATSPLRTSWVDDIGGNKTPATDDKDPSQPQSLESETLSLAGLFSSFGLAMVAGFLLNFMPCVLPVIGLKIAGFVQECSGNNRRTTFLTLWYVAGIVAFLMALAVIIVVARDAFGSVFLWGEQFTDFNFRIGITVVIFAMALSFLGVWDIPIPGFANTQKSGELMAREGASGAFFKGVFSTILATPCSGPFLGPVIASSLTQPWWMTLTLFFGIALGMAFPYLLIAIYPRSIAWLPKPGPWMDTFKQFLAFPLLLTTMFFVSQFSDGYRIAAMTMLIGVWFSCWMFGKVPGWAETPRKLTVWTSAILIGVISGWASFRYLGSPEQPKSQVADSSLQELIHWEPYSQERLSQLTAEGKTVVIDFTADWCLICQTNLATAINTQKVADLIERNGVVPLLADWTDKSPEIKAKLIELKSASLPIFAIYPADAPNRPVVLRDQLFESTVLNAIEAAGPSRVTPNRASGKGTANSTLPGLQR